VPGRQPSTAYTSLSGHEVRVLHGNMAVGARLSLTFSNLAEATGRLITDHFALAQGTYETFALPAEVFAGLASSGYIAPAGTTWRYDGAPSVSYKAPSLQTVTVELDSGAALD